MLKSLLEMIIWRGFSLLIILDQTLFCHALFNDPLYFMNFNAKAPFDGMGKYTRTLTQNTYD